MRKPINNIVKDADYPWSSVRNVILESWMSLAHNGNQDLELIFLKKIHLIQSTNDALLQMTSFIERWTSETSSF